MRGVVGIIIILSVLIGIFSGCKKEKEIATKMDKEVEEIAKSMEAQMQLANPEYIKNATPAVSYTHLTLPTILLV